MLLSQRVLHHVPFSRCRLKNWNNFGTLLNFRQLFLCNLQKEEDNGKYFKICSDFGQTMHHTWVCLSLFSFLKYGFFLIRQTANYIDTTADHFCQHTFFCFILFLFAFPFLLLPPSSVYYRRKNLLCARFNIEYSFLSIPDSNRFRQKKEQYVHSR